MPWWDEPYCTHWVFYRKLLDSATGYEAVVWDTPILVLWLGARGPCQSRAYFTRTAEKIQVAHR